MRKKKSSIEQLYRVLQARSKGRPSARPLYETMKRKDFSPKQWNMITGPLKRLNIAEGSVRSGKTFATLFLWCRFVQSMPRASSFIMVGKNIHTLKRNVLKLLMLIAGPENFDYSLHTKEGQLYGRTIFLEGANDERAEGKIRGITLTGAYGDELTLWPKSFFDMLLSRLSDTGAKFIGTTNPDGRSHWLLRDYLEKPELDLQRYRFRLDDNESLDPEYVKNLKKEYTGLQYKRFILGEWAIAAGAVYDMFDDSKHVGKPAWKYTRQFVSIDYGTQNPCVFGFFRARAAPSGNQYYLKKEYYHDGRNDMQKTDEQYSQDLKKFVGSEKIEGIIVDPSAASLITQLRRDGWRVLRGRNAVLPGIAKVSTAISRGDLLIDPSCKNTIREIGSYVWDNKARDRGEDKPVKIDDHCMDMLRYGIFTDSVLHAGDRKNYSGKGARR